MRNKTKAKAEETRKFGEKIKKCKATLEEELNKSKEEAFKKVENSIQPRD